MKATRTSKVRGKRTQWPHGGRGCPSPVRGASPRAPRRGTPTDGPTSKTRRRHPPENYTTDTVGTKSGREVIESLFPRHKEATATNVRWPAASSRRGEGEAATTTTAALGARRRWWWRPLASFEALYTHKTNNRGQVNTRAAFDVLKRGMRRASVIEPAHSRFGDARQQQQQRLKRKTNA